MILGKKDKEFVETLKQERLSALSERNQLKKDLSKVKDDLAKVKAEYASYKKSAEETVARKESIIFEASERIEKLSQEIEKAKANKEAHLKKDETEKAEVKKETRAEYQSRFFNRLREISKTTSWDALARLLEISSTTLSNYRNGKKTLDKDTEDKFAFLAAKKKTK